MTSRLGAERYPDLRSKFASPAIIDPADYLDYLRRVGQLSSFRAPQAVIMCYQRSIMQYVLANEETAPVDPETNYREMVTIARTGHRVGVVGAFGFGAVAAVSVLEELIALGAKRFITVGTAGALQSNCQIGDILVCDRAIRDDGVSQHYLPPEECASASPRMTELLSIALSARDLKYQIGTTWTTGALYRETKAEIAHYQQQGVVGVEMEAAALFAVARFRSVSLATLAVIADAVIAHPWHPAWASPQVSRALVNGYQACVEALCSPDF